MTRARQAQLTDRLSNRRNSTFQMVVLESALAIE